MKLLLRKSTTNIGITAVLFLMALFLGFFGFIHHAHAETVGKDGSTLLTIHDRGVDRVVLTDEHTIGDALKKAGITLAKEDVVEPVASQQLVASEYQVNIYRARPVVVVDGNTRQKVMTPYQTADQIASSVGITLYPEDKTDIVRSDDIVADGAGLELIITRAVPVNFILYGSQTTVRTQGKTVGDMLKEKGITLGADDRVSPDVSAAISNGMTITVWREGKQTITVEEPVTFTTTQIQDANQKVGYKQVQTAGVNGAQNVTYEIEIINGQEVSRTQIATIVTTPAVAEVDVIGTKLDITSGYSDQQNAIMSAAGISSDQQSYAAYIVNHENGLWCPTRWQGQSICTADYTPLYSPGAQVGYGLCQATPGNKMASAGSDWQTNAVTQMIWCTNYANSRYGSWQAAATHWASAHSW